MEWNRFSESSPAWKALASLHESFGGVIISVSQKSQPTQLSKGTPKKLQNETRVHFGFWGSGFGSCHCKSQHCDLAAANRWISLVNGQTPRQVAQNYGGNAMSFRCGYILQFFAHRNWENCSQGLRSIVQAQKILDYWKKSWTNQSRLYVTSCFSQLSCSCVFHVFLMYSLLPLAFSSFLFFLLYSPLPRVFSSSCILLFFLYSPLLVFSSSSPLPCILLFLLYSPLPPIFFSSSCILLFLLYSLLSQNRATRILREHQEYGENTARIRGECSENTGITAAKRNKRTIRERHTAGNKNEWQEKLHWAHLN